MRIAVIWIEKQSDYVILVVFEGILHGRTIYMELLYSNILPLRTTEQQRTIADCFRAQLMQADRADIAVGYVSRASLEEIDRLADELHVHISSSRSECTILKVCRKAHTALQCTSTKNGCDQVLVKFA